eukprot:TRINITY_DN4204_c0_g1_i1.p2 TRINITY_DN4204_c0_g1~~TRINITY_DN4204_c0_g1_i1.p2  ORF type:complete len:143 (+),score=32.97 TRINITY_DN4204_c0_g1_i1:358-786(+)
MSTWVFRNSEWFLAKFDRNFVCTVQKPHSLLTSAPFRHADLIAASASERACTVTERMAKHGAESFEMANLWTIGGVDLPVYIRFTFRRQELLEEGGVPEVMVEATLLRHVREESLLVPQAITYAPPSVEDDDAVPPKRRRSA